MRKRKKLRKGFSSKKTSQKLIDIELELKDPTTKKDMIKKLTQTSKIKTNPKFFYSYANRFAKSKPKVGPLIDPTTNELTDDSLRMANILQEQYKTVFMEPMQDYDLPETDESNTPQLNDIDFTEEEIINIINTLSANSAAGPDGFPAILLQKGKY